MKGYSYKKFRLYNALKQYMYTIELHVYKILLIKAFFHKIFTEHENYLLYSTLKSQRSSCLSKYVIVSEFLG